MTGLYVITINAVPTVEFGPHAACAGACINVYARSSSKSEAVATASREAAEAGWRVTDIGQVSWVTREDFANDHPGLKYFDQALTYGIVIVVHSFPASPDEETVH